MSRILKPDPFDNPRKTVKIRGRSTEEKSHCVRNDRADACDIHFLDACRLYCRQGRFIVYPKGIVKDGTRCQYGQVTKNDICIGGKCVPVGCDYGIESGFSFDRCGVCNGDSTKCTQVMKTYTDDWSQMGLKNAGLMCVVSRGSKEIWVYEKASDKNAIGKNGGLIKFAF
ncbi:A disintegrin and metalloproteinase with thrombospondin motifs 7-like [Orbicella faveolata]|uniref:A disintegrin and metalloproteinase with thrombospondin motifs 7-like n=1 Tax=Orbicella faveolata TaxID=48498 RepID=UPI0009E1F4D2|nr:A disintegrin and metalloproteinase with thrombospondin motifs 7-like [Orbicella faveolata]